MIEYTLIPYFKHKDDCPIAREKLNLIKKENPIFYKIALALWLKDSYLPFREKYISQNGCLPTKWAVWKFNLPIILKYLNVKAYDFVYDSKSAILVILIALLLHQNLIITLVNKIIN